MGFGEMLEDEEQEQFDGVFKVTKKNPVSVDDNCMLCLIQNEKFRRFPEAIKGPNPHEINIFCTTEWPKGDGKDSKCCTAIWDEEVGNYKWNNDIWDDPNNVCRDPESHCSY